MRVLVTGGAGFIGSHVVDALRASGHETIVIDDLSTGRRSNVAHDVEFVKHDITDPATASLMRRLRPDVVVHAAAQVSVARSAGDPAGDARTNILGSIQVFTGAREAGVSSIVYVTTGGALYGDTRYLPCDEDHPIEPLSPYGVSKWVGERYLDLLLTDTPRVVLRLANVFGPRQDTQGEAGVVAAFAIRMLAGRSVEIHGDGQQTRDFVYVGDVATAVADGVAASRSLTVNIGSGQRTSVEQLYRTMLDLTGDAPPPIRTARRPGDVEHSVLDVRRAARELGWRSQVGLADGLARTIAWYRDEGLSEAAG